MEVVYFTLVVFLAAFTFITVFTIKKFSYAYKLNNIEKKPRFKEDLISELTTFYSKVNLEEFPNLFEIILNIPKEQQFFKYKLIKVLPVDENRLLLLTKCTDNDFIVTKFGFKQDVQNVYNSNFIIKKNIKKAQYEFYSSIFHDLNGKNLKMDFKDELVKFLPKN